MEQMVALRAEWLARLSDAIDGAQRLAWQLGTRAAESDEARELYGRLEAARLELDALRGIGMQTLETDDSDWLQKLGWSSAPADPRD